MSCAYSSSVQKSPPLARYVGAYEGDRITSIAAGALVFRRKPTRPRRPMIAVDDSTFVLGTLAAGPDGGMQMVQHFADRTTFTMWRTGGEADELAQ